MGRGARHGSAAAVNAPVTDRARRSPAARLRTRLREPPPGPFRPEFWRSPLRGPWLTSFLGTLLGPLIVDHRGDRADLARRVLPGARQQRHDQPRSRHRRADPPAAVRASMELRAHAGAARHDRPGHDPGAAGEAVVGDPAAVRVAGRAERRAGARARDRCCCSSAARCSSSRPGSSTSRTSTRGTSASSGPTTTAPGCSSPRSRSTSP